MRSESSNSCNEIQTKVSIKLLKPAVSPDKKSGASSNGWKTIRQSGATPPSQIKKNKASVTTSCSSNAQTSLQATSWTTCWTHSRNTQVKALGSSCRPHASSKANTTSCSVSPQRTSVSQNGSPSLSKRNTHPTSATSRWLRTYSQYA